MPNYSDKKRIGFADFLKQRELLQINFFKECINKTNQFSAQFILEKMLTEHRKHLNDLWQEVQILETLVLDRDHTLLGENERFFKKLCDEFDLSTLTLGEAAKIAIRMEERDLDFFKGVLDCSPQGHSRKALKRIVARKEIFVRRLKKEQSRILSKN